MAAVAPTDELTIDDAQDIRDESLESLDDLVERERQAQQARLERQVGAVASAQIATPAPVVSAGSAAEPVAAGEGPPAATIVSAAPAAASSPAPVAAPPPPKPSERAINRAESWGIPRDDAEKFPTDSALEAVIKSIEKRFGAAPSPQPAQPTHVQQPVYAQPQPTPIPAAAAPTQIPAQGAQGLQPFKLSIPPSLLDPATYNEDITVLVKQIQGMHDHYAARIASLSGEVERLQSVSKTLADVAVDHGKDRELGEFDGFVRRLGDKFQDTFGEGDSNDLSETSPEYQKRAELWTEYQSLRAGYVARGERPPSRGKLLTRAFNGLYADTLKQNAVSDLTSRARGRNGSFIRQPSPPGQPAPQSPRKAAEKYIREFTQEHPEVFGKNGETFE